MMVKFPDLVVYVCQLFAFEDVNSRPIEVIRQYVDNVCFFHLFLQIVMTR